MRTTRTLSVERQVRMEVKAPTPKANSLAARSARLLSWKSELFMSLGRELHTLHVQQQERAFMATSHGTNYRAPAREALAVH
jgi:hypothetical protein